jgi:hypothetical protein
MTDSTSDGACRAHHLEAVEMVSTREWFLGVTDADFDAVPADPRGPKIVNLSLRKPKAEKDRGAAWLRNAMIALGVLAVASAVVSFTAQYRLVFAAKHIPAIAGLEAGIPDVAALIFASLGIALALHGKRAIRARLLNLGAVATSITMNVLAAGTSWRDLAIWAMPPIAYALASDTAIGVVRAWAIARQKALDEALAEDESTPLALLGGFLLWVLRLVMAPPSTLAGFRRWVLEECPVAPGRRSSPPALSALVPLAIAPAPKPAVARPGVWRPKAGMRAGTKTARFLTLVEERHGPLAAFPVEHVSRVCTALAPEVELDPGAARAALRKHVRSLQNGSAS